MKAHSPSSFTVCLHAFHLLQSQPIFSNSRSCLWKPELGITHGRTAWTCVWQIEAVMGGFCDRPE